jgi:hypothetical protein
MRAAVRATNAVNRDQGREDEHDDQSDEAAHHVIIRVRSMILTFSRELLRAASSSDDVVRDGHRFFKSNRDRAALACLLRELLQLRVIDAFQRFDFAAQV